MNFAHAFPTETRCIDAVADALHEHVANNNDKRDKRLAREVNATIESVRNWKQRKCAPNLAKFIALCIAVPEVRDTFHRLIEEAADAAVQERVMRGLVIGQPYGPWRRDFEPDV